MAKKDPASKRLADETARPMSEAQPAHPPTAQPVSAVLQPPASAEQLPPPQEPPHEHPPQPPSQPPSPEHPPQPLQPQPPPPSPDGGAMAKKDAPKRPKTPADYLARLPQFEPHPTPFADFQEYDVQVLLEQGIDVQALQVMINAQALLEQVINAQALLEGIDVPHGEQRIDDVLSKFMAPYIRDATKLKPFLKDAKRAIAGYVGARETEYDRRKAKTLLTETLTSLETTRRKLQEIAGWPELSNYLKRVYRDAPGEGAVTRPDLVTPTPTERPEPSSAEEQVELARQRTAALEKSYSQFAPDQIAWRLDHLETVLSLAAERVTFGPGDAQRDKIAQDFTDQLASAWHSATERNPTCSRPTQRLKNPSPFARLLETINQRLLSELHQSKNNFFEYGVKARKSLPSAKPRRGGRQRALPSAKNATRRAFRAL